MTQRDLWPELLPTPAPESVAEHEPKKPEPQPVVQDQDDLHNPFTGITISARPVAQLGAGDPFAEAMRGSRPIDEAQVDDDVYEAEMGQEIE